MKKHSSSHGKRPGTGKSSPKSDRREGSFRTEGGEFKKRSFDKGEGFDSRGTGGKKRPYSGRDNFSGGDDRPKRPYSGRDGVTGGDKPARGARFNDDKPKRSFSDQPKRDGDDRRPYGNSRFNEDKPKRSFSDRPKREEGDGKPYKGNRFSEDKPKRSFSDKKKPYSEDRERPARRFDDDQPKRRSYSDKPKREDGDSKPYSRDDHSGDDKPKRSFSDNRRSNSGDRERPARRFDESDKPKRSYSGDRKEGGERERPKGERSFGDKPRRAAKPDAKPFERKVSGPFRKKFKEDADKFDREERYFKEKGFAEEDEVKEMTLNKYIAHSSTSSRRDAAELVKHGKVKVNGELMLDPGYRVQPYDLVTIAGKKLTPQKNRGYVLLNKPKGYITTTDDPEGRKTVMELVEGTGFDRLYPVGRLDRNTTGLLLLTNDGDLAQKLSHPSYETKKVYQVTLNKSLAKADFDKIVEGIELEDGPVKVDELAYLDDKSEIGIEIHSGRNRIVRRIFESLGYEVEKLDRVMYAGLTKKNLPRGQWRLLEDKEVILLKHFKS